MPGTVGGVGGDSEQPPFSEMLSRIVSQSSLFRSVAPGFRPAARGAAGHFAWTADAGFPAKYHTVSGFHMTLLCHIAALPWPVVL